MECLIKKLQSTNIPFENSALDMGPFYRQTKIVFNVASGAAQIYLESR